jgi:hypothetical protein
LVYYEAFGLLDKGRRIRRSSWEGGQLFLFRRDYRTIQPGKGLDFQLYDYMEKHNISRAVETYGVYMVTRNGDEIYVYPYVVPIDDTSVDDWEEI